jgi:hypothetical protein
MVHSQESKQSYFHTAQRDCVNPYWPFSIPLLFPFRRPSVRTNFGGTYRVETPVVKDE